MIYVIIPVHNRRELTRKCLDSLSMQSYRDFNVVVVDGGSTDNTREATREFQERDKRIKYFKHKINKGGGVQL